MALLMVTGVVYRRTLLTLAWAVGTLVALSINVSTDIWELHGTYPGAVLVYYFITGAVAFHWRHLIPVNRWLFALAIVVAYALLRLPNTTFIVEPALIYIMIFVGMQKMPRVGFLQRGDYSYGMYLYAYPIQKTLVLLLP